MKRQSFSLESRARCLNSQPMPTPTHLQPSGKELHLTRNGVRVSLQEENTHIISLPPKLLAFKSPTTSLQKKKCSFQEVKQLASIFLSLDTESP